MRDFLSNLVARSVVASEAVQPQLLSIFEPPPHPESFLSSEHSVRSAPQSARTAAMEQSFAPQSFPGIESSPRTHSVTPPARNGQRGRLRDHAAGVDDPGDFAKRSRFGVAENRDPNGSVSVPSPLSTSTSVSGGMPPACASVASPDTETTPAAVELAPTSAVRPRSRKSRAADQTIQRGEPAAARSVLLQANGVEHHEIVRASEKQQAPPRFPSRPRPRSANPGERSVTATLAPKENDGFASLAVPEVSGPPASEQSMTPRQRFELPSFPAPPRPLTKRALSKQPAVPSISVTIGRIEVRASPAPPPAVSKQRSSPPILNLDEYLRERRAEGKSR